MSQNPLSPNIGDRITSPTIYLCALGIGLAIAMIVVEAIPAVLDALPIVIETPN